MPSTVNGIGTHYYGQKNLVRRAAACPHCNRSVQLESYDTRLWFVVVFVPIIPLGRKRIIDKCPSCSRHYSVDADKWETAKQLEVSGAQDKFRDDPTPETAIAVHQQMVNFHQFDEAAAFRAYSGDLFPESALLQAYFGDSLTHFGRLDDAVPFYARALALRPDMPEARTGIACSHIRAGRLDEARHLLDFLEKPGAGQLYSLAPLETLGLAYQKAGRHEDALTLFTRLREELPKISDIKSFRAMVRASEKALGHKTTALPPKKFSWRELFKGSSAPGQPASGARTLVIFGVVVALVALGFVIGNEYIRRHRTVYLVNTLPGQATIDIVGTDIRAQVKRQESIILPEGRYHATISGPVSQEIDFEVRASYFDRWSDDPLWLIDVGGASTFIGSTVTYRRDPPPASVHIHFGRPFYHFASVTHPFQNLPASVQVKSNESRVLSDLQLYKDSGANLFWYLIQEENNPRRALDFAEHWLPFHPDDEDLIRSYTLTAERQNATARATAYLAKGLAVRPVRTAWHRAYQDMLDTPAGREPLVAEYDALLAAEPTDSGLLYLRGRITDNRDATRDYFRRSIQADARNPFPLFGLAYDCMIVGDWAEAKTLLARAVALDPKNSGYEQRLVLARMALGEAAALEQETRAQLKREPYSPRLNLRLIDALVALGKNQEALQAFDNFRKVASGRGIPADTIAIVRRHTLYGIGDFTTLEKESRRGGSPEVQAARIQSLVELGRLDEAGKLVADANLSADDRLLITLALAIAWRKSGNAAEADLWLGGARDLLSVGDQDAARAARWFDEGRAPDLAAARELMLAPLAKSAVLLAVIGIHPESAAELVPLIRRLNVETTFPGHLVRNSLP